MAILIIDWIQNQLPFESYLMDQMDWVTNWIGKNQLIFCRRDQTGVGGWKSMVINGGVSSVQIGLGSKDRNAVKM